LEGVTGFGDLGGSRRSGGGSGSGVGNERGCGSGCGGLGGGERGDARRINGRCVVVSGVRAGEGEDGGKNSGEGARGGYHVE
jgi:hypothetical protein